MSSLPSPSYPRTTSASRGRRFRTFAGKVIARAGEDRVFLLAAAITFNLLVAFVPLLLLAVGIAGHLLSARVADPAGMIVEWVLGVIPAIGGELDLVLMVRSGVERILDGRGSLTWIGAVIFIWTATRVMGTLRDALGEVFDVSKERGIIEGKLFDGLMVLLCGILATVNIGITVLTESLRAFGVGFLGLDPWGVRASEIVVAHLLAFGSIWGLFALLYRWAPARATPWRTVVVSATFTAILFEVTKVAFGWYVTEWANYGSTYGNLATAVVLFLWIHYGVVVFIVGGEVGQVYAMRRAWRVRIGRRAGLWIGAFLLLGGAGTAELEAQEWEGDGGVLFESYSRERQVALSAPLVEHDGPYVVVHIAENRVYVMEGNETLWSSPAGTGTGFRLEGAGQKWLFTTPQGIFRVLRKEKDPIWQAPDWYYVEKGLRPPALNSPSRLMPGVMGTSAIYLGDGLAIHGTNSPANLMNPDPERRRVSHGCIRLTNEAARELYHMVDVGTPVLIY